MSRSRLCQGILEPPGTGVPLHGFTLPCSGRLVFLTSALPERPSEVLAGLNLSGSLLLMTMQGCKGGCYIQSSVGFWVSLLSGTTCLS